jgi:hypothetical protein
LCRKHFALGRIIYPDGVVGKLLYIKSTLTGDEPVNVTAYAKAHPQFPHQSTADQWFDESQFESYRTLGTHSIADVFRG